MKRSAFRLRASMRATWFLGLASCSLQAAILLAGGVGASPAQTVSMGPRSAGGQTAYSAQGQPSYTLQTSVRRVYEDVVVIDSKGHPVKGLKRDDFQVYEDGVVQPVRGFDVHEPDHMDLVKPDLSPNLPPNTFANLVRAPENSPVTIILYDMLNTPTDAMPYAHEAMVRFIQEQKSSHQIAIFVLGSQLRMLQGFTDNDTRLLAAINSKQARTQQSRDLMVDTTEATQMAGIEADLPAGETAILSELKSMEASESTAMLRDRLELTVNAFAQIARYVSTLRGRKNLIWLSGSFPSSVLPNGDSAAGGTANEFGDAYSLTAEVNEMDSLLNMSHVVIYPVDVRGLKVNPVFSAASNVRVGPTTPAAGDAFSTQQAAEHGTMDSIADSTGGRAFYNTNGLKDAMQSAVEDGSCYYTLTYAPTNTKEDGTLRHIRVQLRGLGYRVEYRRSYVASRAADVMATNEAEVTPPENVFLDAGMQHGAPISPELFIEASVYPVGGVMPASGQEMEALGEFLKTKTKRGSMTQVAPEPVKVQHYEVNCVALGRQLELPPVGDGKYATDMTFALAAYSPDSLILNGLEVTVKNQISEAQFRKIKTQGYHASMIFVVPVEASALRLAAMDGIGHHMGTVEVPLPVAALKQTPSTPAAGAKY